MSGGCVFDKKYAGGGPLIDFGVHLGSKLHSVTDDMRTHAEYSVDAVRDNREFSVLPEHGITVMKLLDTIYTQPANR